MISLAPLALAVVNATVTGKNPAEEPWAPHDTQVLVVAAIGIAIVVLLIVLVKFHAFLALTIGALFVGIASGIPLDKVTAS
ncbi:MAG: gluconate transporter, partial [Pseudolysinimonas sp.]